MNNNGKLVVVSGLKYGLRGGYNKELLSPKLLAEAANHSLASSTWSSYMGVWNRLMTIARETGSLVHAERFESRNHLKLYVSH